MKETVIPTACGKEGERKKSEKEIEWGRNVNVTFALVVNISILFSSTMKYFLIQEIF